MDIYSTTINTKTNKLKCLYCEKRIPKNKLALVSIVEGKLYDAVCFECENGKKAFHEYEMDNFMIEMIGHGQE